jgi:hypothetical protein
MLSDSKGNGMASRRNDHEGNGFGRKLTVWVVVILVTVWASREPHQAAAVVHTIATAIANAANHGKSAH